MKNLLNQGLVLYSELKPMTAKEKDILTKIRNKKKTFFFSTFSVLLLVIILSYFYSINRKSYGRPFYTKINEEEKARIMLIAPYFFSIVALVLIIYFINYYYKLILPYIKDIKSNVKEIVYYDPGKFQTPFFAEYYIVTPITNKARVKVSKEIFDEIDPNSKASISLGKHSRFIFEIEVDGRKINFNETYEPVDV